MWKVCIVIALVLTIFCVVKTFQMSNADQERCLSSYISTITAMRIFSLLSKEDTLYQTMDLKCNNGSLHGLLTSVFINFYKSIESLKMQSSIIDMKNKVLGLNRKFR